MLFENLTSVQKWAVALIFSICLLAILSPMVFNLLSGIGDKVGIKMKNSNGCSSLIGILVQVILFFLLARLVIHILSMVGKKKEKYQKQNSNGERLSMNQVLDKPQRPYTGLASPADMLRCDGAAIYAENENQPECVNAARICMSKPFSLDCNEALRSCASGNNSSVIKTVLDNCGFGMR